MLFVGASPSPPFGTARTHQSIRKVSSRAQFPRLDSSEATPSNHSSVVDAVNWHSGEYQSFVDDEISENKDSYLSGAKLTNENIPPWRHLRKHSDGTSPASPRPHGLPLDTIIEQQSRSTLQTHYREQIVKSARILRPSASAPSMLGRSSPITFLGRRKRHWSADDEKDDAAVHDFLLQYKAEHLMADMHDRNYAEMAAYKAKIEREKEGLVSGRCRPARRPDQYLSAELYLSKILYSCPAKPTLPPMKRIKTPPGLPRWPGDLPTNFNRTCNSRRCPTAHLRELFRKLRTPKDGNKPLIQQNNEGTIPIPQHLSLGGRTGQAYWRPPQSGHAGRQFEELTNHPWHFPSTEQRKESEPTLVRGTAATGIAIIRANAPAQVGLVSNENAAPPRVFSNRISSLITRTSHIFEKRPQISPVPAIPSTVESPASAVAYESPSLSNRPLPPAPLTIRNRKPSTPAKGSQLGPLKARIPTPTRSLRSDPGPDTPSIHHSTRDDPSVARYTFTGIPTYRASAPSLRSVDAVTDDIGTLSIAASNSTTSIVAGRGISQQTSIADRGGPTGGFVQHSYGSDPFINATFPFTPPITPVQGPLQSTHTSDPFGGCAPLLRSSLKPSPLRPHRPRANATYSLFPPPVAVPQNSFPRPTRPWRSISSMLRIPSTSAHPANVRSTHSPSRPSAPAVSTCQHGRPIVRANIFTGRKLKRCWWHTETYVALRPEDCWQCSVRDVVAKIADVVLDCGSTPATQHYIKPPTAGPRRDATPPVREWVEFWEGQQHRSRHFASRVPVGTVGEMMQRKMGLCKHGRTRCWRCTGRKAGDRSTERMVKSCFCQTVDGTEDGDVVRLAAPRVGERLCID